MWNRSTVHLSVYDKQNIKDIYVRLNTAMYGLKIGINSQVWAADSGAD